MRLDALCKLLSGDLRRYSIQSTAVPSLETMVVALRDHYSVSESREATGERRASKTALFSFVVGIVVSFVRTPTIDRADTSRSTTKRGGHHGQLDVRQPGAIGLWWPSKKESSGEQIAVVHHTICK